MVSCSFCVWRRSMSICSTILMMVQHESLRCILGGLNYDIDATSCIIFQWYIPQSWILVICVIYIYIYIIISRCLGLSVVSNLYPSLVDFVMANVMSSILDADPRGMNSMIAYASDLRLHHRTHRWDFIEATMSHWNRIVPNRFRPRDEVHQGSTRSHSLDAISLKPCAFESVFFMMRYEWCFHDASSKIWCLEKKRSTTQNRRPL